MFHTRKLNKNHKKGEAYNFVVPKLLWANDTLVWVKAQLVIFEKKISVVFAYWNEKHLHDP